MFKSFITTSLIVLTAFMGFSQEGSEDSYPTKQELLDFVQRNEFPKFNKLDTYRMLGEYYMGESKDSASFYFNRAINLSKVRNDSFNAMKIYNRLASNEIYYENDSEGYKYTDSSLTYANYNNEKYFASIAFSYKIQATIHYFEERYDLALEKFLQANRYLLNDEQDDETKSYLAENYADLASIYFLIENKQTAMQCIEKSLAIAKPIEAWWEVGEVYEFLAEYYSEEKEYELSRTYIDSAKLMYNRIEYYDGIVILDKYYADVLLEESKFDKAIEVYKPLLQQDKNDDTPYALVDGYIFLSSAYEKKNDISKARIYLDSARVAASESENSFHSISLSRQQANIYKKEEKVELAITELSNILSSAEIGNYIESKKEVLKELYELYEKKEDPITSYMYFKEYTNLKDSLKTVVDKNKFTVLQSEFNYNEIVSKLESKEAQLKFSKEEQQRAKDRNLFIVICISLGALFLLFSFFRQRTLSKTKREVLKSREETLKLKKKALDTEVRFKNQQITNFAIQISEKNELLEKLKLKLKGIKVTNKAHKETVTDAIHFINNDIENDKEKIQLYQSITETTDSFRAKIDAMYSDLSEKEKKVAIMLRLGQTSKQIALQLGISSASVDNYRYNLRKKMNISKGESLKMFIKNI